jgi:adenylyltransferase/sulfurtransferase
VYAAVSQFEGQVSVFHYRKNNGQPGPNYRDLFPVPPPPGSVPDCAEGGVLGVLPGIIGSMQALEVIKIIVGIGEPLSGRLFIFDALGFESRSFRFRRRDDNPLNGKHPSITQLLDYEVFCGIKSRIPEKPVKEISADEFRQWQQSGVPFQLIDVREPHEYAESNLGGELIPLGALADAAERISTSGKVVIHCHSGARSAQAIQMLEEKFGWEHLYNLKGGMLGV